MKKTKLLVVLLTITTIIFSMQTSVFAEENNISKYENKNISIEFSNEVSEETKERVIAHFLGYETTQIESKGLTCTLFGHNLDTGTTQVITHEVRTTAPRCLKEYFTYEICTRCDYSEYTLTASEYFNCCS